MLAFHARARSLNLGDRSRVRLVPTEVSRAGIEIHKISNGLDSPCPLVLLQEKMYILRVEAKGDLPNVRIAHRFATRHA